ncbi:MAG: tRNA uridine-5-carboxymethylaminomethyl(34) synthesis GTPase MnmE [Haliea sp.]|jgi:tRNA modification GTPase|nr:tRNA uridine-5-carboxymethylaminomethyl(34) synthesis GTPase MnmE [Haliea sp.]MDP4789597.1 tRNA uridine-5-carboxymethylaminomethyl(34) synthesis GTPase MnmE [Haliea sp.]
MNTETDTIAAIATAPGRGGIGIVRLSGPDAQRIAQRICGKSLTPRHAHFSTFRDSGEESIDSGIALYFPSPHSFTGEDVVELQGHGGPVIMDLLMAACLNAGARQAQPGEFSERAYLNDKLDLAQAEAIADLINSTTAQAARNAHRSLQGAFSTEIKSLINAVTRLRIYVEAAIDFPEEEIDFLADGHVANALIALQTQLSSVMASAQQGSLLREGMKVVLAGQPNAGKSSLLNALAGQNSAIVTAVAGTTRDVLREHIQIDGMPLHIVDTAGLRDSDDAVEKEGIRRAREEIASADRILLVMDMTDQSPPPANLWPGYPASTIPVTIIHNKCDLAGQLPALTGSNSETESPVTVRLCARSGEGITLLREHLKECMGFSGASSDTFSARRRHLEALRNAEEHLKNGRQQLEEAGAGELLAEDLKQCHDALGQITGKMSSDALLGEIFSSFCIGK